MAAEIGLLSLTETQKFPKSHHIHHQQQPHLIPTSTIDSRMWHPNQAAHEDDSWEVRAFAEDTANAMGTTWPPRSYTCTFCRREFRSAQALGGHMNVHRRDRAQLHQNSPITTLASATTSSLTIPTPELVANSGLCLLYSNPNSNPNPNGFFSPTTMHMHSPSAFLSISPYPMINSLIPPCSPSANFTLSPHSIDSSPCHISHAESSSSTGNDNNQDTTESKKDLGAIEELDLELRLGRGCV